jgi:hypothetical protein
MESLLIGGAQSVGKTAAIYRLADRLLRRGFNYSANSLLLPSPFDDFKVVLEGNNKHGKAIRIIINSATDDTQTIQQFKLFFDNNGTYDILVSSIRDDGYYPRPEFFTIMGLVPNQNLLEIPLGKITRRSANVSIAHTWYANTVDQLVDHTLMNPPYNI